MTDDDREQRERLPVTTRLESQFQTRIIETIEAAREARVKAPNAMEVSLWIRRLELLDEAMREAAKREQYRLGLAIDVCREKYPGDAFTELPEDMQLALVAAYVRAYPQDALDKFDEVSSGLAQAAWYLERMASGASHWADLGLLFWMLLRANVDEKLDALL